MTKNRRLAQARSSLINPGKCTPQTSWAWPAIIRGQSAAITAVTRHLQYLQTGGHLAEGDDADGQGQTPEKRFSVGKRCYPDIRMLRYQIRNRCCQKQE
jgi:hypothetical protein